jgi:hypothetical protein
VKVLSPTPALSNLPFLMTKSHSLGWDYTQCCFRRTPKLAAAITSPETPQTYLGGLKNMEATKEPAAPIAPRSLVEILSAI